MKIFDDARALLSAPLSDSAAETFRAHLAADSLEATMSATGLSRAAVIHLRDLAHIGTNGAQQAARRVVDLPAATQPDAPSGDVRHVTGEGGDDENHDDKSDGDRQGPRAPRMSSEEIIVRLTMGLLGLWGVIVFGARCISRRRIRL